MESTIFDHFARQVSAFRSRRRLLRGLPALVLSLVAASTAGLDSDSDSHLVRAGKRKKKRKKLKKNAFGCVNVGGKCRGNGSVCCSGICQGKKPKKGKKDKSRCVGHNALNCPDGENACVASSFPCGTQNGLCYQTTGQAGFCASGANCVDCRKDADCDALGYGPGAACGWCGDACPATGTACFNPSD